MTTLLSTILSASTLSGLMSLAIVGGVPIEPIPVRHDGFDCVVFVPQRGGGFFYLCDQTALSMAWRET